MSEGNGRLSLDGTVAQLVAEEPPAEGFEIVVAGASDGRYAQVWDASPEEDDTALVVWLTDDAGAAAEEPPAAEGWGGAYGMVDRDTGRVAFPFTAFVWEEELDGAEPGAPAVEYVVPDGMPRTVPVTFYESSTPGRRARPGDRLTRGITLTLQCDPSDPDALFAAVRDAANDEALDAVQARIGDVVVEGINGTAWAVGPDELTAAEVEVADDGATLEVVPSEG